MSVHRPEPSYFVPTVPAVQLESMCGDIYSVVLVSQDRAGCLGSFYMNYFFSISVKNMIGILSGTALSLLKNFYYIDPLSFQLLEPSIFFFQVSLPVLGLLQGIFTSYFTGQLYMRLSF